ncbi:MAG: oxidoreductase [Frondihabitans sp.]|nr:oxidoreductase [Frondihabitans sp.]
MREASPSARPGVTFSRRAARSWAALNGLIALAVFLASAEISAIVFGSVSSPLFAVGSLVIDLAPKGAKGLMVSLFGTGDKVALFALMGILLVVITALAGLLEWRRPPLGRIVFAAGAAASVVAVITRSDASELQAVPSIVGGVLALLVLRVLTVRLHRWRASTTVEEFPESFTPQLRSTGVERRRFLQLAVVAGGLSVVLGSGARFLNAVRVDAEALRDKIRLPRAAVLEKPVPAGASLRVAGITPYVISNDDFYRIDTALQIPQIDPATWTLKITGLVEKEVSIGFDELLARPLVEHMATLSCVSNDVGGDLVGNALWLGYPIRSLLAEARPRDGADMVLSRSVDGFTAGTPLSILQDVGTQALLAVGMNGAPLPLEHGFPVRMVVPGLYGYVSATKWVVSMEVTKFSEAEAYWTTRGYSARAPVKIESRIDTPSNGSSVDLGTVPIAGVAWQPHVGVKRVEVRIDEEPWQEATLADSVSADTWRQWVYRWPATKGTHKIQVRATNGDGQTQPEAYVPPAPNGAEGWDEISVTVR